MDIMTHAKFNFNQLMLTLIFGIWASEPPPPPGPGERLKRPGLIGLKKYSDYHQVVHEIDHMSDLLADSSFYRQSMKIDNYFKILEWMDFSIGQSTVIQELDKKGPHYPT